MKFFTEENNSLCAAFEFPDFISAFAFMTKVAILAEKQNHHPNWSNVYNKLKIQLSTHDAGSIVTEKDHLLANAIEALYSKEINQ